MAKDKNKCPYCGNRLVEVKKGLWVCCACQREIKK